jgi:predicted nucleic acid-binding protein
VAKIYLDACALNRLTDDQSQPRTRSEAEAVEKVLYLVWKGEAEWMASIVLEAEIRRNPDRERRNDALKLISLAGKVLRPHSVSIERARALEALGYGAFDALHLACAEQGFVDAFLTTDDRLIRQVGRDLGKPTMRVLSPVNWVQEVGR